MEVTRSVVFERTSYPPSYSGILQFSPHMLPPFPFDTNAYICSVAPCLRVLWMSTHGCFSLPLPPFPSTWLSQPDVGAQDPDATVDNDYYNGGAYYYVQAADDDQE